MGREEILVLGDSHASVFGHDHLHASFPKYSFRMVVVAGATVSGLENPNTKTQALAIFKDYIGKSKATKAVVLLGEVDTGFVIWYRAEKYQASISEMLEAAWRNYRQLLSMLTETHRVICVSTPLPTIKDEQDWGEVANARREVKASHLQRTKLTVQFNRGMQEYCEKNGITYLSFDEESLGQDGLVDDRLLNPDPNDHHYDMDAYAAMVSSKLCDYL